MSEEIHYRILKLLHVKPDMSQRELSRELGISLGKTNYCIKAMLEGGWIKVRNFKNSRNKMAYVYLLTPKGIEKKAKIAVRYLRKKMEEFELLEREIEQLRSEISVTNDNLE